MSGELDATEGRLRPRSPVAVVLRVLGTLDLLALVVIVLPTPTIGRAYEQSGLGPFPSELPIVAYLARSTSALYALHGVLLLALSTDVERYRPVITVMAAAVLVHGLVLLGIDLSVALPPYWTWLESLGFMCTGAIILWLQRRSDP